ncbi:MAG TPA: hypothetical protein VKP60_00860 [Magnetospirillaceae bacterium]|nr:hypothetical protein [Magnetospirillaceae bacterium]
MTVRNKARLIFLAMFLIMFGCGALGGRLGVWLGFSTLLIRNGLSILCSYLSFLMMMGFYVRAVRGDREFLGDALVEGSLPERKSGGLNWLGDCWAGDFDGWLIVIALLGLILLVGLWIGIEGPALLLDEASAMAIAAGLAGRTAFMSDPSWLRRVIGRTIIPAAIYLFCSSILMGYADVHCPGRLKFSQVVKECVISPRPPAVETNY